MDYCLLFTVDISHKNIRSSVSVSLFLSSCFAYSDDGTSCMRNLKPTFFSGLKAAIVFIHQFFKFPIKSNYSKS